MKKETEACMRWLNKFAKKRKSLNSEASPYSLKHLVERYCGFYIPQEDFEETAIIYGYKLSQDRYNMAVNKDGWDMFLQGMQHEANGKELYEQRKQYKVSIESPVCGNHTTINLTPEKHLLLTRLESYFKLSSEHSSEVPWMEITEHKN